MQVTGSPFVLLLMGIAFLMLGTRWLRGSLQNLFEGKLKSFVDRATARRRTALWGGFCTSFIIPSSTGCAVFLSELASTNTIPVRTLLTIFLGAQVGLTLVVQILSLPVVAISPYLMIPGIWLMLFAKHKQYKLIGEVLAGFGFLLYGMGTLSYAAGLLKNSDLVTFLFSKAGHNLVFVLFLNAFTTVLLQSSTAALGLLLSFTMQQILPLESAVMGVLGVNLGLGFSAYIVGMHQQYSRRFGLHCLLLKSTGVITLFPMIYLSVNKIEHLGPAASILANLNSGINIFSGLVLLPLLPIYLKLSKKLLPQSDLEQEIVNSFTKS